MELDKHTQEKVDKLARSIMSDLCLFALSWSTEAASAPEKYQATFDKTMDIIRSLITRQHPDFAFVFPIDVEIRKESALFVVDPKNLPGSPSIGRGVVFDSALGDFLRAYQKELGLNITVHESALPAEMARRRRALASR